MLYHPLPLDYVELLRVDRRDPRPRWVADEEFQPRRPRRKERRP